MEISFSKKITLSGMLVAIGILLPFFTSHAFGVPGTVLLPMHIPVLLTGLLCGPRFGAIGGLITPVLSSLFTGMPTAFPMLPIMAGELFTYGLVSGLLYHKTRIPLFPSLVIAMVSGRIAYGLIFSVLLTANNGSLKALSVTGALITGIPGIIIQLILIPVVVTAVRRYWNRGIVPGSTVTPRVSSAVGVTAAESEAESEAFERARQMIKDNEASCVLIKNNVIIHAAKGSGVAPLIKIYEETPCMLKGAFVVDRIIGKAAAAILLLGEAEKAYGEVMSNSARAYLSSRNFKFGYGRCVDIISNRTGNGICPLEKSVLEIDDPEAAYHVLKETIARLRSAG